MTTKQAFDKLLSLPNWYLSLGVNPSTARSLKMNLKRNLVSDAKMQELLLKSGAKKKPEVWSWG